MLKLFGAALIVLSGTMLGMLKAKRLADRPLQIRRFVRILGQLETEITYGYTPLPEALAKIGSQASEPFASIFSELATRLAREEAAVMDIWQQTMVRRWPLTAMRSGEKEIIVQLGLTLGTTDREDQIKHLHLAAKQLESLEIEAAEDRRRYERMWRSLGLLGGLLIAIMMY